MSVAIKQCPLGKGIFATEFIVENQIVWTLEGVPVDKPTRSTIYIGNGQHVDDPYGIYFNHSFNPNCKIDGRRVLSLVDIQKGDELTFDYTINEPKIASPFEVSDGRWVK